jgi:hypothetical protein
MRCLQEIDKEVRHHVDLEVEAAKKSAHPPTDRMYEDIWTDRPKFIRAPDIARSVTCE